LSVIEGEFVKGDGVLLIAFERLAHGNLRYTPSFPAISSRSFAATSTGTVGSGSPVFGPYSLTRATCPVCSPQAAAALRSRLCAATIMHCSGFRLSASQAAK